MSSPPSPDATRKRSTKACDQCRKSKTRCDEWDSRTKTCNGCFLSGTQCTFLRPNQKRGPPKGYLNALESRLQEAEALLGVIISSDDQRARTLIQDLSRDTLACGIIKRVTAELCAQEGKDTVQIRQRSHGDHTSSSVSLLHPFHDEGRERADGEIEDIEFTSPSHNWQEQLDRYVATGSHSMLEILLGTAGADPPSSSPTTSHQFSSEANEGSANIHRTIPRDIYEGVSPYSDDEQSPLNEGFPFPPLSRVLDAASMPVDTGQAHPEIHANPRYEDGVNAQEVFTEHPEFLHFGYDGYEARDAVSVILEVQARMALTAVLKPSYEQPFEYGQHS